MGSEDADVIALRGSYSGIECSRRTLSGITEGFDPRVCLGEAMHDGRSVVRRTIADYEDLKIEAVRSLIYNGLEHLLDKRRFITGGNDC